MSCKINGFTKLTEEQHNVVCHPLGCHARVLAVAGSGKTTTMAYRASYLIKEHGFQPKSIAILMFNALARKQFEDKLTGIGLSPSVVPKVNTFHSISYAIINDAVKNNLLPRFSELWINENEVKSQRLLLNVLKKLEHNKRIEKDCIDVDEAREAISLWKGALIPPGRAGHNYIPSLPTVYAVYEEERIKASALTYDDFIPLAVGILYSNRLMQERWCNVIRAIIVDEYQDVNYGQQRLLELLASNNADVMAVGDDDQTIYEWRGARSEYILKEFCNVFNNKKQMSYILSKTFRFGPIIAQCAQNVIECNINRMFKQLVAGSVELNSKISVFQFLKDGEAEPLVSLALKVKSLVKKTHDPSSIVVLGRVYAQFCGLESVFLRLKIPYRVIGQKPFFMRREIRVLVDYIKLSTLLDVIITCSNKRVLLSILNVPNRKINKDLVEKKIDKMEGCAFREFFVEICNERQTFLSKEQLRSFEDFFNCICRINEVVELDEMKTGEFFKWLCEMISYDEHIDGYFGKGEDGADKKDIVNRFVEYAGSTGLPIKKFIQSLDGLDTTQGVPEEQQIVLTTIFRTKGLEFDYVVIPECDSGFMPVVRSWSNLTYDLSGKVSEPNASSSLENERRLFYVAISRARKGVYISCKGGDKSPFVKELYLKETTDVLTAKRCCSVEGKVCNSPIVNFIKQYGNIGNILTNLVNHYLDRDMDKLLIAWIEEFIQLNPRISIVPVAKSLSEDDKYIRVPKNKHRNESLWWMRD